MAYFRAILRLLVAVQAAVLVLLLAALPFTGRALYRQDALEKADAIFVLAGERVIRWLEASELVREGWADTIVLAGGYREATERRLLQRGIRIPSEGEVARDALVQLGHPPDRVRILGYADNTAEEGSLLRREALERRWSRVIVVTSKLHTRRAGFAVRRELEGTGVQIIVRAPRYDDDDPARYWTKRRTMRSMLVELPKLVAYLLGLRS
ncbi:MAG TPA: YdcF family protein [Vicinamibacterales bacterium]|nr:YdcF family protein [Vicinamibacterales bacterium]